MKQLLPVCIFAALHCNIVSGQTYFAVGTGCNEKVYTIAADPSNTSGIYAGGAFVNAGGSQVNYISKWDGNAWTALAGGVNFYVRDILPVAANEVYVAGAFNLVGTTPIASWGIAKWNGSAWSAMANGIRGDVYALKQYNSQLYACGAFDTTNNFNPGRGILQWNGTNWIPLGAAPGSGVGGPAGFKAKAMEVFNGELFVGGTFNTASGTPVNNIAKWNGSSWSAVGTGTTGEVNGFTVYNNELYVAGAFSDAGGVTVNGLAKITGTTYTAVGGGVNGTINSIQAIGPYIYITGSFTTAGGVAVQNIARWDGNNWSAVGLGLNFDGYCLAENGSNMYIGGFFTVAGTAFVNNIARYSNPTLGIQDDLIQHGWSVYPNPATDVLTLTTNSSVNDAAYQITDISGRICKSGQIINDSGSTNTSVDVSELSTGSYFFTVIGKASTTTSQFSIVR